MHCYPTVTQHCSDALLRSRIDRLKSGTLRYVAHTACATTSCVALNFVGTGLTIELAFKEACRVFIGPLVFSLGIR
jgi:hypothetical protein